MKDHQDRIGQQIAGYRLLSQLGRGSFGMVYLAEQIREHTPVAIKLLQLPFSNPQDLKNFLNEARIMRLRHPHIVPLLDFGLSGEGLPFLVMEYAAGGTLRDRYPRGTQLPLFAVSRYVSELASALQYAHESRVIHRDIKPENMLLRADGSVLLSDFGIARMVEYGTTMSVQAPSGTPAYMAPEQTQGKPIPASDQYALAVVVYEWLAGCRPFLGAPLEVAIQHRYDAPPSLCAIRPDVPQDAERVLFRALAKQPAERFATVVQFAQALSAAFQQTSTTLSISAFSASPEVIPATSVAPVMELAATQPLAQSQPASPPAIPSRGRLGSLPSWLVALLVALVFLIIGGGVLGRFVPSASLSSHPGYARATTTASVLPTPAGQIRPTATLTARQKQQAIDAYNQYVSANGIGFGFDVHNTRYNPYEHILGVDNVGWLQPLWKFSSGSGIYASPTVANGMVYIGSTDGKLYAIDAVTGQQKWAFKTGRYIKSSSAAVMNGVVYVGGDDGNLYAIDAATGQQKWAFKTGSDIDSSPIVVNGVVYVGSDDHNLYAIDAATGQQKWAFTADYIQSSPAVVDGVVYIGVNNSNLYAVDAAGGQQKWTFSIRGNINATPAVVNGVVYIGSGDASQNAPNALYAIDAVTGQQKWAFPTGYYIKSSAAVANGVVYVGSEDQKVYALDATTGRQKWAFPTGGFINSSPTVANGVVYIGSSDSRLYALDAASGQQKWAFITGDVVDSSPTVANGIVYVGSQDHNLYAFALP